MTNTTQIRAYIESQGLKLGHVARVLGICIFIPQKVFLEG